MPGFEFVDEDGEPEPLFDRDDPLTFSLFDRSGERRVFRCVDDPILPDDATGGIDTRPRSYLTEMIASQVVDDQQDVCRDVVTEAWDDGRINERKIMDLMKFLGSEREQARKALAKRKLKRPTRGHSPSTD